MVCSNQPTEGGRSPTGRATLASHQAPAGLGHAEGIPNAAECEAFAHQSISDWAIEKEMERSRCDWHNAYLRLLHIRTRAFLTAAQRIEARSDETLQAARPEGQEPDGEADAPTPNQEQSQ